jgi:hypothetical protein
MFRCVRNTRIVLACTLGGIILLNVLGHCGVFNTETWTRKAPLTNPIAVQEVREGILILADSRTFRPAGVHRHGLVSPQEYDRALRTIVAQGVIVIRDLGDGRAFLLAEPRFYNWCGTRGYGGNAIQLASSTGVVR